MHKLSGVEKTGRKHVAYCFNCDAEVEAIAKPRVGGGVVYRCKNEVRAKNAAARSNVRKQDRKQRESSARKAEQDAHFLWRQIVFERAGRCCEICGKGPFPKGDFQLQAHHLVKRSQSTRLLIDPQNGAALCAGHHQWADRDPIGCLALIEKRDTGLTDYLLSERRKKGRIAFEDEVARLRKVAAIYDIELEEIEQAA